MIIMMIVMIMLIIVLLIIVILLLILILVRQTCHFRKRATSVPAEGPAHGLDFARHCAIDVAS